MSVFSEIFGFSLFTEVAPLPYPPRTTTLPLASSRRYSLAVAATAALALPSINRQELTLALAEWRVLEGDATVRRVLDDALLKGGKK